MADTPPPPLENRVLAPLSEIYGRLPLYRWTNAGFVYFTALGGIAWTFPLLVVLRFLQGCVASVPIVIGGATIADLFPPATRGQATSWVFFSAMLGPPLGPVAGAFLSQYLGWRWTFGMTAIMVSPPPPKKNIFLGRKRRQKPLGSFYLMIVMTIIYYRYHFWVHTWVG